MLVNAPTDGRHGVATARTQRVNHDALVWKHKQELTELNRVLHLLGDGNVTCGTIWYNTTSHHNIANLPHRPRVCYTVGVGWRWLITSSGMKLYMSLEKLF